MPNLLGGTLSQLAADRGLTVSDIQKLNPNTNLNTTYSVSELNLTPSTNIAPVSSPVKNYSPVASTYTPTTNIEQRKPTPTPTPVATPVVPKTLSEYYISKGQSLPSLSQRATLFQQLGLGSSSTYAGTANQNNALLSALSGASPITTAQVGTTYSAPKVVADIRNKVTSYSPVIGLPADIKMDPISGLQYTADPNSPGGKKYMVPDGKTANAFTGEINDGANKVYEEIDAKKQEEISSLDQQQRAAAIKQIATGLGLDEAHTRDLLASDPTVRSSYDAALAEIKAGTPKSVTQITPPQTTNGNNAYYKIGNDVYRTSDNAAVTMGNTDPSLDWNKLGLNIDHLNSKENVTIGLSEPPKIPDPTKPNDPNATITDPVFDGDAILNKLLEDNGINEIDKSIKELSTDGAAVKNFYQEMHDEIRDNPEFPQWLKARRNEFVTTMENRALTLYNDKIKALQEERANRMDSVKLMWDASVKEYETTRQAKQDALSQANVESDNDRALLGEIMTQFADQGINWSSLTPSQKAGITSQFNDPNAANILGSFDFAKPYDAEQAIKWASENRLGSSAAKKAVEGEAYGYKVKDGVITGTTSVAEWQQKEWVNEFIMEMGATFSKDALTGAFNQYAGVESNIEALGGKDKTYTAADVLSTFKEWKKQKAIESFSTAEKYKVGDIITDPNNGNKFKVVGFYPDGEPNVEPVSSGETSTSVPTVSNVYGKGPFEKISLTQRLKELQDQNISWGLPKNTGLRDNLYNNGYPINEIDKLIFPVSTVATGVMSKVSGWLDNLFGVR